MIIPVDLNHLEETLGGLERQLDPLEPDLRFKVLLVCEEILTNLARHADFGDRRPEVTLALDLAGQQAVHLTFRDNATPFDPGEFPDPELDAGIEKRRPGGLGIYLLKQYAGHIEYRREQGGNILRITL